MQVMKKNIIPIIAFLFLSLTGLAQYQTDALLFSQNFYEGSAKSVAMGGSLSAVGADLTNMATNPAGMALYRSGIAEFTPTLLVHSTDAVYNNNLRNELKFTVPVANIGFVNVNTNSAGDWTQFSLGISYNRTSEYSQDFVASGVNNTGSILDYYVYNANIYDDAIYGDRWEPLREGEAYEVYLFDQDINGEYFSHVIDEGIYGETQRRAVSYYGGAGEADFSLATAYKDVLFLGLTMGITSLNYSKEVFYTEENFTPVYRPDADGNMVEANPASLQAYESLDTEGSGINFKFGFILKPSEFVRFGLAVHSPTFYQLHEYYETRMSSGFHVPDANGDTNYDTDWNLNEFDWNLRTPFRANAGLAFIVDQKQIGNFYTVPMTFSFGYEYVDYSRMYLKSDIIEENFDTENSYIDKNYGEAHSFNFGTEFNFGSIKLRGGYALYTSPDANVSDFTDDAVSVYSGGLSFAWEHAYIDLTYSLTQSDRKLYMYDANNYYPLNPIGNITEPTADLTSLKHQTLLTLGLRF